MIEVGQLINLFGHVIGWLKTARDVKASDKEEYKKALLTLYLAANETRIYIATLKRRKRPDRDREARLSRLWSEAAVELREIDPDLAKRCLLKGEYWADPTRWTDQQIADARISLKELFDRARELL